MDRQVLGILKGTLQHDLGWNDIDFGNLVLAFQGAYAVGMVVVGRVIDRLGTRLGYALSMVFWSLASMGHALGSSFTSFIVARSALGFGESGVFPASIKTVAEWFPKKERALATGIFNAGTNLGAIVTPLVVPSITIHWGWRWAFLITGASGFVWLAFWLLLYRRPEEHPRVSKAELDYIRSDPQVPMAKIKWARLIPHRQTWAFVVGKFMTDPIWWFYLFWIPDFLQRKHGLALMNIRLPIVVIYVIADVGSVAGGWFSSWLIHRGRSVNVARKSALLICAVCVVPIVFAYNMESLWGAVLLIGLAAAAHQGFSANLFTLTSDTFPAQAVGSVVGMGGMAGAIGGMLIATIVGHTLQWTGSYMIPFLMAGLRVRAGPGRNSVIGTQAGTRRHPLREAMILEAFELKGKNALVTGSSRGLGAAIAIALAQAGANVGCHGRSSDGKATSETIRKMGRNSFYLAGDMADAKLYPALIGKTVEEFGSIDILVNNAGMIRRAPAAEYPHRDWDELIAVNLTAVFRLSQLAGQDMLKRGAKGKILNIASLLSFQGGILVPAYAAAKGGVAQLTKALANEWASKGINVNAIAPGYMMTDNTTALRQDPQRSRQILERIPAGRWGEPGDVAGAAVFLCSSASDYIHGHVMAVDGGWLGR